MSNQQPTGQPAPARSVQSQPGGEGTAGPAKRGVCLLVHARNERPPEKLTESLARHGAAIVSCFDLHTVLARACRINRGQNISWQQGSDSASPSCATPATSRPPSRAVVVILVEPRSLNDLTLLADLAEALRRYAPRSTLWFFEDGASKQPLREVTGEDLSRWTAGVAGVATATGPATGPVTNGSAPTGFMAPVRTPMSSAGSGAVGSGYAGLTAAADRARPGTPRLRLVEPDESGVRAAKTGVEAFAASSSDGPVGAAMGGGSLAGDGALGRVESEPAPHLLTAEELSMLLGDPEGFGEEPEADVPESTTPPGPPAGGSPAA